MVFQFFEGLGDGEETSRHYSLLYANNCRVTTGHLMVSMSGGDR